MAQLGTAGLALRPIARELGLTATALYRYFPSLDDLITALIVEAFNALADSLETARNGAAQAPVLERLRTVLLAYREYAVSHPTDFELIYGSPIPGYDAPREVTVPAASRSLTAIVPLLEEALQTGALTPAPPYDVLPPAAQDQLTRLREHDGYPESERALYLTVVGWTVIHGMIMLELFGHTPPLIGDPAEFYAAQVDRLIVSLGGRVAPSS